MTRETMRGIRAALTPISSNSKTGPIPVSSTSAAVCPDSCPFSGAGGCYAAGGPQAIHWRKITSGARGDLWPQFCGKVAALPAGQLWRHNVAGDLIGDRYLIDRAALRQLTAANTGRNGFTYTHYNPMLGDNSSAIAEANRHGFTVNLSGNNPAHADTLASLGIGPVVTVLPADATGKLATPSGRPIRICPAVTRSDKTCANCGLCAIASRRVIIGFPAHGSRKNAVNTIALGVAA